MRFIQAPKSNVTRGVGSWTAIASKRSAPPHQSLIFMRVSSPNVKWYPSGTLSPRLFTGDITATASNPKMIRSLRRTFPSQTVKRVTLGAPAASGISSKPSGRALSMPVAAAMYSVNHIGDIRLATRSLWT